MPEKKVSVIIAAAGSSSRMGGTDKQLKRIDGVPVVILSAMAFERSGLVGEIIISAPAGREERFRDLCAEYGIKKLSAVTPGGGTRFLSVRNSLSAVSPGAEYIAVHDGARPLIETEDIERVILAAFEYGGAIAAAPASDTVKTEENGFVSSTPDRSRLYLAQTPQVFSRELYLSCIEKLGERAEKLTDDSALFELCGEKVRLVPVTTCNIKITRPEDLVLAEAVIKYRKTGQV